MFDTHSIARTLREPDLTPARVDAITVAVLQAADHGDHVTSDQFKTGLAELRREIAGLRADLNLADAGRRKPGHRGATAALNGSLELARAASRFVSRPPAVPT